ncbi:GNAT family N-acetyltransferase [Streptomyces sp. A3M-1-3]|uniref:GNAT family N-acetyltransferase n=1 Tax=Streptomyces sp. A3M-1-3 TaxID=2962044 RepID=UPI0020B7A4A9|nr:GNAT family N-acetyltransferase [Streptomyces sp. A3M-1-3]MCP3817096.1 GNAT family N-acetyltransferase [Streptomyces sp. A3M-1-3]
MTTTLRPTGPIQHGADGAKSRQYRVCVNSRPVGMIELGTDSRFGPSVGRIASLHIDEQDRRRGRATVAALAAEEVLRGWGCVRVEVSIPAAAAAARHLASALGYTVRNRNMLKRLPAEPPVLPAGSEGRPMSGAEYAVWIEHTRQGYVRNLVGRGIPEEQARAKSDSDHASALPGGERTPDTYVGVLRHEGTPVGTLWVALRPMGPGMPGAYVFDVEVAVEHRGRGHGRTLMLLAEREARAAGVAELGLNVYADNTPAVSLYDSLGYETTEYHLYKQLL